MQIMEELLYPKEVGLGIEICATAINFTRTRLRGTYHGGFLNGMPSAERLQLVFHNAGLELENGDHL